MILLVLILFSGCSYKESYKEINILEDSSIKTKEKAKESLEVGTILRDVMYKETSSGPLTLDLYTPLKAVHKLSPVLVYVHGGSWCTGDNSIPPNLEPVINQLRENGYTIVSINYRLVSDEIKFPIPITDVKDSLRWLHKNSADYKIDSTNIGILGISAGAHLAMMAAYSNNSLFVDDSILASYSSKVRYVVDFFGPTDLSNQKNYDEFETVDFFLGSLNESSELLKEASPINYLTSDSPETMIVHGKEDTIVPPQQSKLLMEKGKELGLTMKLFTIKNAKHDLSGASAMDLLKMLKEVFDFIENNSVTEIK